MKKVKSKELTAYLTELLKRKPKANEIKEALGLSSVQIYYNRIQRDGFFSEDEVLKIGSYYNFDLSKISSNIRPDAVEIVGFPEINGKVVQSIWLDKKLVREVWCRHENDLKILQMQGNMMNGGFSPIHDNDTLIIDTSINELNYSGVFAYTTKNMKNPFVNTIEIKADGSIKFSYFNSIYKDEIYTKNDLVKMDFKILGQVIKNLSLGL